MSRPRLIFGIDGVQALDLAIHYAKSTLKTSGYKLEWLGQSHDLGFPPRLLACLPKREQQRIERMVEREVRRTYAAAERRAAERSGRGERL